MMFLDPSKLPYFLFVFRIELGLSTVIGNDDEIDTNICISFMLQDNPMKFSGQGVSDICTQHELFDYVHASFYF